MEEKDLRGLATSFPEADQLAITPAADDHLIAAAINRSRATLL
jgi:hypothetical protein